MSGLTASFAKWPPALAGFAASALLTLLVFAWMYLSADAAAASIDALWAQHCRDMAMDTAQFLILSFAVYWGLAALLGKGRMDGLLLPNALLIGAVAAWLAVVANDYYGWTDTYCDQLPYPHEGFAITRIHECPSNVVFFSGLIYLAIGLWLASLVLRIHLSRRRERASQ